MYTVVSDKRGFLKADTSSCCIFHETLKLFTERQTNRITFESVAPLSGVIRVAPQILETDRLCC